MTKRYYESSAMKTVNEHDKKSPISSNHREDKEDIRKYVKDEAMLNVLNKKGITKLFPIQYETFDIIYQGNDIVAKDRTGSGKTIAFTLPVLMRLKQKKAFTQSHKPKFLIVLPTRQLAIQVKDEIKSLQIPTVDQFRVGAVYGGSQMGEQIRLVKEGIDILVGTPGRLIDFLEKGVIDFSELEATCLDEADEMLNMGFKENIEQIFKFITKARKGKTQNLLFSATIPDWIWSISEQYQEKNRPFIDLIKNSLVQTSTTVSHYALNLPPFEKEKYLQPIIHHFLQSKPEVRVIIFCETKREVKSIGESGTLGLRAGTLHGDMKQFEREIVFKQFKSGQLQCIVATNVAARGLDFPSIDLVIQMQPPKTTDAYIHRSGRTGRAGKKGICVTLYTIKEQHSLNKIEEESKIKMKLLSKRDIKTNIPDRPRPKREEERSDDRTSHQGKNYDRSRRFEKPTSSYKDHRQPVTVHAKKVQLQTQQNEVEY